MRDSNRATRWLRASLPLILACTSACSSSDNGGESLTSMGGFGGATVAGTGGAISGGAPSIGSGGASVATGGVSVVSGGAPATVTTSPPSMGGATAGGAAGAGGAPGAGGGIIGNGGQNGAAGAGGAPAMGGASGAAGTAGMSGASGGSTSTPCDGKTGTDSATLSAGTEYGAVKYSLATSNHIVDLKTVLKVPKKPTSMGTLFIWPGLQWLGGTDPARLGNGILQPVLTWGGSCNPMQPKDYSSWWIAGMYVNVSTSAAGPTGCAGGAAMNVQPAELLDIDMALSGTTWKQTITDEQTSKSVDFSIDLKGQAQDWATFAIEIPAGENTLPPEDVLFTDNVLTFASPVTTCQPNQRGPNDYFSAPQASADGLRCCIAKITLRAKGVAATTMP